MPSLRRFLCNLLRCAGLFESFATLLLAFVRRHQRSNHVSRALYPTAFLSHCSGILTHGRVCFPKRLQVFRRCFTLSGCLRQSSVGIERGANLLANRSPACTLTAIGLIGKARTERAVLGDQHLLKLERRLFADARVGGDNDVLGAVLLDDRPVVRVSPLLEPPSPSGETLANIEHTTVRPRVCVGVKRFHGFFHEAVSKRLIYLRELYHLP